MSLAPHSILASLFTINIIFGPCRYFRFHSHPPFQSACGPQNEREGNVDFIWIIMSFCLPLTVISGPQCCDDYWALPTRSKEGEMKSFLEGGSGGLSHAERSLSISQQGYSVHPPSPFSLPLSLSVLNEIHTTRPSLSARSLQVFMFPVEKHSPFFNSLLVSVSPRSFFFNSKVFGCSAALKDLFPCDQGRENVFNSAYPCQSVCECVISLSG